VFFSYVRFRQEIVKVPGEGADTENMARFHRVVVAVAVSIAALSAPVAHAAPGVYVVKQGDSLSRIADKLDVRLTDLLSANSMTVNSLIVPGQQLVVPGGGNGPAPGSSGTYTVKAGDSLSGIATRHQVKLGALLAANGMTVTSVILPGQTLNLPAGAVAPSGGNPSAPSNASTAGSYTVKAGDSLSRIASRHGVKLGALLAANNLAITSLITPGMTLALPAGATTPGDSAPTGSGAASGSYTVKAGDSLSRIASRHGVKLSALLAANNMTISSLITPGMTLVLPAGAIAAPPQSTDAGAPQQAPGSQIQTVLDFALAQQGKPYRFAASGPDAYDCSGLTKRAYAQVGVTLVHQSAAQATQGAAVAFWQEPIRAGDLVFMATRGNEVISHVGIAIDGDTWIQARRPGDVVRVGPMPAKASIVAVRRFVP
jgi:LysM repeat protein